MSNTLFRCPNTGLNVQHFVGETSSGKDGAVVVVNCPACARIHLVNLATDELLRDAKGRIVVEPGLIPIKQRQCKQA